MTFKVRMGLILGCSLAVAACSSTASEGEFGLQSDGSFHLTAAEQAKACGTIRHTMRRMANETVALDLQTNQEIASSVVWGILFGVAGAATYRMTRNAGEASKQAKRNRAKLAAYNDTLRAKGCKTWNYEAHMNNKRAKIRAKHAEQRRKNQQSVR